MALAPLIRAGVRSLNRRLLDLSYRLNLPFSLGGPVSLMVEPSAACNLRCPLCPTGLRTTRRDGYTLSPEDFERSLGWFRHTLQSVSFWNYGEPFLNRNLGRMVAVATRNGIHTCVSTNGHFLSGPVLDDVLTAGLSQMLVAIDTPHGDLYDRYRVGGDFEVVVKNFRHAVARKKALGAKTHIVAQYMLMSGSEDIDAIIAHGEAMGADKILVKTLGIGSAVARPSESDWALMPEADEFKRYDSPENMKAKVHWDDARCSYIWRRMVLNSDGSCVPCCRDQNAEFQLGDIKQGRTLASVWNARAYRDYRRKIRQTQRDAVMCQRCPELVHKEMDPGMVFAAPAPDAEPLERSAVPTRQPAHLS